MALDITATALALFLGLPFIDISIGNSMICSDIWHKYHE